MNYIIISLIIIDILSSSLKRPLYLNAQLLQRVSLLGVEVESHLIQPLEAFRRRNFVLDEFARHIALMHMFDDEVLELAASHGRLLIQDGVGEDVQCVFHGVENGLKWQSTSKIRKNSYTKRKCFLDRPDRECL